MFFLAGVASLLTIWIIIYYDQIGKLYQFVYLYADKLNCVVKTEKRFILHENLKNPAHLNEISLLFNHHSDVHKQRSRNVDIFCIFPRCFTFNIFIKNKRQCIGRSDDRSRRGGGYFEKIMNALENTVMITSTSIFCSFHY